MQQELKKREYVDLDEQIKAAKERQARGEPGAAEQLRKLQKQRTDKKQEIRQAGDEDYRDQRRRRREQRNKLEKFADTIGGDR